MSRLLAALIVCGVFLTGLSAGGYAHSVDAMQNAGTPHKVQLAARENKNPQDKGRGLPVKKPRKPTPRTSADNKKSSQPKKSSRGMSDKKLCLALRACRNEFVRCKGKIKHPDQSKAWSIAKEVCGAQYKTCVEKDFKGGEWFFTRWFYFGELDCK